MDNSATSVFPFNWSWEIVIAIVAMISSIAAPIITAALNNHHQRKLKRLELKYKNELSVYQEKSDVFSKFCRICGTYLRSNGNHRESILDFGGIQYRILLYVSDDLKPVIFDFIRSINFEDADKSNQKLFEITRKLSDELGEPPQVPR